MADENQSQPAAAQTNAAAGNAQFPPEFFTSVNEFLDLTGKQARQYGEQNVSVTALFAAARFNAHVFLASVKPIAAADERLPFIDHMTTMYRRMLNEHLDGLADERGVDVGDSELAEEYKAAGVKVGRLKNQADTPAAANE